MPALRVETPTAERAHLLRAGEEVEVIVPPVPARLLPVPKPGGIRWLTLLPQTAAAGYAEAVGSVAPAIESRLGTCVFANRVVRPSPLQLEPWRVARGRFRLAAVGLARRTRALAIADVRECFASIEVVAVEDALVRSGCGRRAIASVLALLRGFEKEGIRGLPIGPEPSAVLANAVLAMADETLAAGGSEHLRWVDDFVVAASDADEAGRALERLRGALESMGLSVNEGKTRVLQEPDRASAALLRWPLSDLRPADRLRADAHALSSLASANPLAPRGRGLDPHRRSPRPARGRR